MDKNYFFGTIKRAIQATFVSSGIIGKAIFSAQAMEMNDIRKYLPSPVVNQICIFLSPKDVFILSQVNKYFYKQTSNIMPSKVVEFAKDQFFNENAHSSSKCTTKERCQ